MSDDNGKAKFQIDLGAKAELKLGIEAKVPENSTGRLVDALTDIIRPLSENRGLKADLIRLQREDVAIKIALKARERLQIEADNIKPVPTKVLLPLLENGSLEADDDDAMHDQWAGLLASAASRANVEPRYLGILRELQGRQAKLLERVATNNVQQFTRSLASELFDTVLIADTRAVRADMEIWYRNWVDLTAETLFNRAHELLDRPGCAILNIIIFSNEQYSSMGVTENSFGNTVNSLDFEILSSLGLVVRHVEVYRQPRALELQLEYYRMTELGAYFFLACNNIDPEPLPTD